MAIQVFVSHTQKDVEFCDIFDRACARVGIRAYRSEFEKLDLPAWQTIRDAIRKSQVLFLLIGKELVKSQTLYDPSWSYTQNWIAFEIGVACERNTDVWVLCDDAGINFPVPYLSNYLPRSIRNRKAFDFLVEVLNIYLNRKNIGSYNQQLGYCCTNQNCQASFNLWITAKPNDTVICPQCLHSLIFNDYFPKGRLRGAQPLFHIPPIS